MTRRKTNPKPAGRKALSGIPGDRAVTVAVTMTEAQRAKLDRVSDGKPSAWVRAKIDDLYRDAHNEV